MGFLALLVPGTAALAHTPVLDADLSDWCLGTATNSAAGGARIEDSSAVLSCGRCSVTTFQACVVSADCPGVESCVDPESLEEIVWWDNRTDAAVNDVKTLATTQDAANLYFALQLWGDPDPISLPFLEIGLDVAPGGNPLWHDPNDALTNPGTCSLSTTRGCAVDTDCHFCTLSTELPPSTRPRTCGSGCDPNYPTDLCDMTESCVGAGSQGLIQRLGEGSNPVSAPDYLIVIDFSRWLVGAPDSVALMRNFDGTWMQTFATAVIVNPGTAGGIVPPGAVELALPFSAFASDFVPGQTFQYSMVMARDVLNLDYAPDGAIEDVMSEAVAGRTTDTGDSCPGAGLGTTLCEIADGSTDAFIPPAVSVPGGRVAGLSISKTMTTVITLEWGLSCSPADSDYELYEGAVGDWNHYEPLPGLCTTGGMPTAAVEPGAGDRFYLVVPTDGSTAGSYGLRDTIERPPSASACTPQSLGDDCL